MTNSSQSNLIQPKSKKMKTRNWMAHLPRMIRSCKQSSKKAEMPLQIAFWNAYNEKQKESMRRGSRWSPMQDLQDQMACEWREQPLLCWSNSAICWRTLSRWLIKLNSTTRLSRKMLTMWIRLSHSWRTCLNGQWFARNGNKLLRCGNG